MQVWCSRIRIDFCPCLLIVTYLHLHVLQFSRRLDETEKMLCCVCLNSGTPERFCSLILVPNVFFSVCIIKIGNALIVRNQNCNLHVEQRSEAQVIVPFLLILSFFSISMSFQVQMFKLFPWFNNQARRMLVLHRHRQVRWENVRGGKGWGMYHRASRLCCMLPEQVGSFYGCHRPED